MGWEKASGDPGGTPAEKCRDDANLRHPGIFRQLNICAVK